MKKYLKVAKWEYLERIKNKTYIFMTFFLPIIVIGLTLLPALISSEEDMTTKVIGIVEKHILITEKIDTLLSEHKTIDKQPVYIFRKMNTSDFDVATAIENSNKLVLQKDLDGFIYIEKVNPDSFLIEYHTQKVTALKDISRFEKALNQIITQERLNNVNLNPDLIKDLTRLSSLKLVKISEKGKENLDTEKVFLGTFFFIMFLIISLIMSASLLVRSVVEEKSTRIIEILLSSCSTNELMAGKILGLSALGLTQIVVWVGLIISIGGPVIINYIQIQDFGFSIVYFVLGYIFYASLFIGIGSIGNTEQESQTITSFLSIIVMMPVFLSGLIIANPESKLGDYLSYFPLTTAPMMMMRINLAEIGIVEKLITIIILLLSIYGSIWFSGKIFRVAILSYGKTPSFPEILKWLKSK